MEPPARPHATLVDLLDRVLDRGLVVNADIVVSLAGVPLIGINLRAALAGMETMVQYGLMRGWDQAMRSRQLKSQAALPGLAPGPHAVPTGTVPRVRGG